MDMKEIVKENIRIKYQLSWYRLMLVKAEDEIRILKDEKAALLSEVAAYQDALGISADLIEEDDAADKWEVDPDEETRKKIEKMQFMQLNGGEWNV